MRSTGLLVHIVRRHHFVLDAFPEVFEGILDACTLKYVYIFDGDLIRHWVHL